MYWGALLLATSYVLHHKEMPVRSHAPSLLFAIMGSDLRYQIFERVQRHAEIML